MSDSVEFSWGKRLLVIGYGLGLLIIGLEPLTARYGNVIDYLLKDALAGASERPPGRGAAREREAAPLLGRATPPAGAPHDEKLDNLTNTDRKELNKLIEGLK